MPFAAAWMDLEIIILSEVNQTERQIPYDNITCMWNLRYDTNELIYETETGSQRTHLLLPRGRGGWEGKDWEFGVSGCKVLYTEWINNKVLLYSTVNYIRYPVINTNGKEYEKEYT